MLGSIIAAAMMLGAAGDSIQVDVGRANWKALPPLRANARPLAYSEMVGRVEQMFLDGKCRISGQSAKRFDITVPYAVLVQPDGSASRVIVGETGCADLESYVGLVVLERARLGDFQPTGEGKPRWYASTLNFNLQ